MEKLTFVTEDQESVDFYIIEETRVNGINYLLVTESEDEEDEEAEAYILKDTSKAEDTEAVYEFVESPYLHAPLLHPLLLQQHNHLSYPWIKCPYRYYQCFSR